MTPVYIGPHGPLVLAVYEVYANPELPAEWKCEWMQSQFAAITNSNTAEHVALIDYITSHSPEDGIQRIADMVVVLMRVADGVSA